MMKFFINIFFIVIFSFQANSEIINKIEIEGNNRISNSNIILFGKINLNEENIRYDFINGYCSNRNRKKI